MNHQTRLKVLMIGLGGIPGNVDLQAVRALAREVPAAGAGLLSAAHSFTVGAPDWVNDAELVSLLAQAFSSFEYLTAAREDGFENLLAGPDGTDFFLGRYAAAAQPRDLQELIRRAVNRDGSSRAIEVGSEIFNVLVEAGAGNIDVSAKFVREGFDLGNFAYEPRPFVCASSAQMFGVLLNEATADSTFVPAVPTGDESGETSVGHGRRHHKKAKKKDFATPAKVAAKRKLTPAQHKALKRSLKK